IMARRFLLGDLAMSEPTPTPSADSGTSAREPSPDTRCVSTLRPQDSASDSRLAIPGASDEPTVPAYQLLGELGRGGMGVVYKARQFAPNRIVALKMILAGQHAGEDFLARFRTEAEVVAGLQHSGIVQIYEFGEHAGLPFFSLEFCPGGSLEQKLRGTPLQPGEAAALVEKLARVMEVAHQKGVVHRDLKSANVLLAE